MILTQIPPTEPEELAGYPNSNQSGIKYQHDLNRIVKADMSLAYQADHALWKDAGFRATDRDNVDVRVQNGVVYLRGHINSTTSRQRAETILRSLPAVLGVYNGLVADDRLLMEVAVALAPLEHTYGCKFFTGVSQGVVSLNGFVPDEKVQLLAEKAAAANPDVRGVINNVRISGGKPAPQIQPFLQPRIGEEILFLDGIPGRVRQVIINPDTRRVIAMTIQGRFTTRPELRYLSYSAAGLPEQLILVRMGAVRFLTSSSGFLNISSTEKKQYQEFDPGQFVSPKGDWKAPYPYVQEDVLFRIGSAEVESRILQPLPGSTPTGAVAGPSLKAELGANDSLGG